MSFFKNRRHQILVTIDDEGKRTVFNDGISFVAPEWYQPAYDSIEEIDEDEYNELMKNSARGADGFGSSDVKH